ncbi:MAG TPA: TlpA family protein disulfide reductase [Phnomibacter sp.]|nr:TlpA family protein disulfide reductase [Phnomibacter sp.]
MKRLLQIIFLLLWQFTARSQQVRLMNIDQLNKRIENGKDTTFIINFWATWCSPCVKELPNFEKLNKEYQSEKLKVLLVSVDYISKLKTTVIPFVQKRNIKSEVFVLNEKDQQQYIDRIDPSWSGSIPATLFIKNGKRKFIEKEFTYAQLLTEYKATN